MVPNRSPINCWAKMIAATKAADNRAGTTRAEPVEPDEFMRPSL